MTPTPSEINRRLAEYAGATNFHVQWGIPACEIKSITVPVPDYYNSADLVLPLVERVCRERDKVMDCFFWGDSWSVQIGDDFLCSPDQHEAEPTLPAAICLALVAVLDAGAGGE